MPVPSQELAAWKLFFLSSIRRSYEDGQSLISRCRMPDLAVEAG